MFSIRLTGEAIKHAFLAGLTDLEYSSHVGRAASESSAVEVAGGVTDQACVGTASVGSAGKGVEGGDLRLLHNLAVGRSSSQACQKRDDQGSDHRGGVSGESSLEVLCGSWRLRWQQLWASLG